MTVSANNRFTIRTDDGPRAAPFHGGPPGLADGVRADPGFPGARLYAGKVALPHVMGGRPRTEPDFAADATR